MDYLYFGFFIHDHMEKMMDWKKYDFSSWQTWELYWALRLVLKKLKGLYKKL